MLDGFLRNREVEVDSAVLPRCGQDRKLKGGKDLPGVAVSLLRQMLQRCRIRGDIVRAKAPFNVVKGPVEELKQVIVREGLQLENLRAGNQGRIDVKVRVVSGGANEANRTLFEMWQEHVLLGLVESVNLINEQKSALIPELGVGAGLLYFSSNVSDVGFHSIQCFETGASRIGHNPREGGFSGSGRPVENEGCESVCFNRAPEEFSFSEDVLLTSDFGEGNRTHASGQRFLSLR